MTDCNTLTPERIGDIAREFGFGLCGVAAAVPLADFDRYQAWRAAGYAGEMRYLTDYRGDKRGDPRELLASAKSVICLGMLYNGPEARSVEFGEAGRAWISRYAWGADYHDVLRVKLEGIVVKMLAVQGFEYKLCIDTAPLLERSYARMAGLGWIGKNTCLIREGQGSWFFLAEILTSLELEETGAAPDRCGTCTRCIDACPTGAIVAGSGVDSRLCISYLTIESRGAMPEELRAGVGRHVFGCDICQDVCPWNRRAPVGREEAFAPREVGPELERLAGLTEGEFREMYRGTPVSRARYSGFLRNVAVAMGNSQEGRFRGMLEKLAGGADELVAEHARWALGRLIVQDCAGK